MSFYFFALILYASCGHTEGFFSKIMNPIRSETDYANDNTIDVCESVKVMPRIAIAVVGGAPLRQKNSAPYIAAVGERTSNGSLSWFCGGSLISSNHVLTAAHCLISRNVTTIRVGSFLTTKKSTDNDYDIENTIIHPLYKITQSYNDIAIIKTNKRVNFSKTIKPVCLPEDDNNTYEKQRAKVVGWGAEEFGGEGSLKLQQVEVEVFPNSKCDKDYLNSTIAPKTFPRGIRPEQLCAGSSKGGKDACQGDSGGPLVLTDENGVVRIIGIVSTGAGCGFKMYPGVYVRVSSYLDWIQNEIKTSAPLVPVQNANNLSRMQNPQYDGNKNHSYSSTDKSKTSHSTSTHPEGFIKHENHKNINKYT